MSSLKRPSRPKKGGLIFSSTPQKRRRSASPISIPSKRIRVSPTPGVTPSLSTSTSTTEAKIQTRVLIISDTHGLSALPRTILPSQDQKIDIVLHCGDLSECGTLEEYKNTIELLESIPAPLKLVIPGNHDLTLDRNFWESNCTEEGRRLHEEARAIWTSPSAKEAGIKLLEEGAYDFVLDNGAKFNIYASPYTINSQGVREWGFGYESVEDRFNPEGEAVSYGKLAGTEKSVLEGDKEVDVVMTHGPAKYRLDISSSSESLGCPHLFRAMRRTKPKLHVFGHVHKAYGAEFVRWQKGREMPEDDDVDDGIKEKRRIEGFVEDGVRRIGAGKGEMGAETVFVNAALMGRNGELENAPWLVDVELEPA
ncbi:Metallo-dependent phosphatase-like protein [Halenospora varia]|nr:Metallo-dependent phosphatase-like protein [Halenospora varia]